MFLLDNDMVRASWAEAKSLITGLVAKHGGEIESARHWAERRLAYPIRRKRRGTYLLAYVRVPGDRMAAFRRDLGLEERVLRYLILRTEEVPAEERELSLAEQSSDFILPPPPADEKVEIHAEVGIEEPPAEKYREDQEGDEPGDVEDIDASYEPVLAVGEAEKDE
jgi:small subunit ribosomal protein S6